METMRNLLAKEGSDWRVYESALAEPKLQQALQQIKFVSVPPALVDFYRICNSGEGSLPFEPWTFVLWPIEEVVQLHQHPHYREYFTSYLFFGGNGAGEYFGLDQQQRIVMIDPIAGDESAVASRRPRALLDRPEANSVSGPTLAAEIQSTI